MLKNDLVSVIMPTFNRCHTLKRAFDSILKQSYRPIEIVIIDDASQDDTKNFVLMYKKKYCSTECD